MAVAEINYTKAIIDFIERGYGWVVYGEEEKERVLKTARNAGFNAIALPHERCKDVFAIVLIKKQVTLDAFLSKGRDGGG